MVFPHATAAFKLKLPQVAVGAAGRLVDQLYPVPSSSVSRPDPKRPES